MREEKRLNKQYTEPFFTFPSPSSSLLILPPLSGAVRDRDVADEGEDEDRGAENGNAVEGGVGKISSEAGRGVQSRDGRGGRPVGIVKARKE
jgi:hypothetical protein